MRPKGFEPPTFWLGVDDDTESVGCGICGGPHDLDDCPIPDEDLNLLVLLESVEGLR